MLRHRCALFVVPDVDEVEDLMFDATKLRAVFVGPRNNHYPKGLEFVIREDDARHDLLQTEETVLPSELAM